MFEQAKEARALHHFHRRDRPRSAAIAARPWRRHDEREQTLNQLLVEMDGFEGNEGVIRHPATKPPGRARSCAAATGAASTAGRACRSDVPLPRQILKVHMRKLPLRRGRQALDHRARHAGFFRCRSCEPCQRGRVVRRRANKRR